MRYLCALLALALPVGVQAEWMEAQSAHFVVYAEDSERDITAFSQKLELYHQAMEGLTGADLADPSASNRVTVFVVKNEREVQKLYGGDARYIGGFYLPRAGGSVAIVPRVQLERGQPDEGMLTLLHEYAHHFLISNSEQTLPRWLGEGTAEFFASAEFPGSGGIKIGMPAYHRAGELLYSKDVKVEQLLDPSLYAKGAKEGFDSFYGKSWLLYHYLVLGGKRPGQLAKYLALMAAGKSSTDAGREAFGDLTKLEHELDGYMQQRLLTLTFPADRLAIGPVSVRALRPGEAAMMPLLVRSKRGVDKEQAAVLVAEARKVAAGFPQDPTVLSELAEAEFDSGNNQAAVAAADAALALDPHRVNALVQKGYALFRMAEDADDDAKPALYNRAVADFLALNKEESNHPLALEYYYLAFAERGLEPPENAVRGLRRAVELAPFDEGLRLNLASYDIQTGNLAAARHELVPVAYAPHGGSAADSARHVIDGIDGGKDKPQELLTLLQSTDEKD
jgi:Flp pilus assembly protein TadD